MNASRINRVNQKSSAFTAPILLKTWFFQTFFTLYTLSVFVPWVPRSWQPPCNNSWALVLHNAFVRRATFGTDVIFTFGPYGFLYYGATPQTYLFTLLGWILISLGYAIIVWKAIGSRPLPTWQKFIGALLVTAITASVDVVDAQIFAFIAFATAAWIFNKPRDVPSNILVGSSLALASLVKFSWFIAIVPCLCLITTYSLFQEKKGALLGITYVITVIGLWLIAGQSIGSFGNYVSTSLDFTSGYASAMQINHPWGMKNVWAYLGLATLLAIIPICTRCRKDLFPKTILSGSLGFILLIAFKAGFVRQDHHEVVAMAVLVSIAILLFYVLQKRAAASILVAAALVLFGLSFQLNSKNPSFDSRFAQSFNFRGALDFLGFLSGKAKHDEAYAQDMSVIAHQQPFNLPSGSVDLYPWGGIDAMYANRLNTRHRPIFESYAAFTGKLARINLDFLRSPNAPDQLLFAVRSLDQRFPAMDDGLSWPEIITHYDIKNEQNGYLVMQRLQSGT